ncbi:TRAP transporter small permease [Ruegeria meonggei]|uniref:TRAP transporter small permease protein n=1 Tax=Ruegeria meonggei TaxID=1446476 RepID=A0A1X7A0I7_9RHOB|nr:TRAP transporter small permease subunit [Ruegeria meonggei]SLN67129.1 Tripartite ATP-independent periplasmic transporters, DctQ component [Ruegeria meonggei]
MGFIVKTSDWIARVEAVVLKILVAAVLLLMILNVTSRAINWSLYWVDELAINLMVIFAFVGSSLMFAQRRNFAVTLLSDAVSEATRRWMSIAVQCVNLGFALFLAYACWVWFDPATLAMHGFDLELFFENTFNSVYQEVTNTIGVRRLWFFLIMPLFALTLTVHSAACLWRDLADKPEKSGAP